MFGHVCQHQQQSGTYFLLFEPQFIHPINTLSIKIYQKFEIVISLISTLHVLDVDCYTVNTLRNNSQPHRYLEFDFN